MKVLFTHSYFLQRDSKQWRAQMPYPPLGTLYAAAAARDRGFEVAFFDVQFASTPEVIQTELEGFRPDVFVICDDSFNYLSKMCLTNMREAAFVMQQLAKKAGCKVVVASSDATDHAKAYLENGADAVVIGEAEETIVEWLQNHGKNSLSTAGLCYIEQNEVIKTPPRKVKKELDEWPLPAWDLLDFTPYREMWMSAHGYASINLVTTRGCPYKCNWCAKPVYGNRYNSHSVARTLEMIETVQQRFGVQHIWFADDIFGLKPGWVVEFANQIKEKGVRMRYKIQSRADLLSDQATIQALAHSGCDEVWMGAESGSQKILDAMDKGVTVEEIYTACKTLTEAGVKPCLFLQFGYPGEKKTDIRLTFEMVRNILPHDIGVSVSYPLPGTLFYDRVKADLTMKQNWKESDDLEIMFSGEYPVSFYKKLQRLMHYQFRCLQGWHFLKHFKIKRQVVLLPYYWLQKLRLQKIMDE